MAEGSPGAGQFDVDAPPSTPPALLGRATATAGWALGSVTSGLTTPVRWGLGALGMGGEPEPEAASAAADAGGGAETSLSSTLSKLQEVTAEATALHAGSPSAEKMGTLVYDRIAPALRDVLAEGLRPPSGWLPSLGATAAPRSVWALFGTLRPRVANAAHTDGYHEALVKTARFVEESVSAWKRLHGLEQAAVEQDDAPPLELSVLVSLGLHEGALAAWLRLVLGDAEHTARLYEPGATLRLDSGRAAQVVALCVSLPPLAAIRPPLS